MADKQKVLVNLGSGPDGLDGWINIDFGVLPILSQIIGGLKTAVTLRILSKEYLRTWPKIKLWDLRRGIPLLAGTVDWVYTSHFLEHLEKREVLKLLNESKRVLKKGGRIRIVLPDLKVMAKNYLESGEADEFCRNFYGFDKDKVSGVGIRGHQWMWDRKSIESALKDARFQKIEFKEYRKSTMPDVKFLDLEIHRDLSLYVEGMKT